MGAGGSAPAEGEDGGPAGIVLLDGLKDKPPAEQRTLMKDFCQLEDEEVLPSVDWFATNVEDNAGKYEDVLAVFPDGLEKPVRCSRAVS
jgi:hypothetical protein